MNIKRNITLTLKSVINRLKLWLVSIAKLRGYDLYLEKYKETEIDSKQLIQSHYISLREYQTNTKIFSSLPISKAKSLSGYNRFSLSEHHAVKALDHIIQSDKFDSANLETLLYDYFNNESIKEHKTIKNLGDIYYIKESKVANYPPWAISYPWSKLSVSSIEQIKKNVDRSVFVENFNRGIGVGAFDGGSQYVFTSPKRARLESRLISKLFKSISKKGFDEKLNSLDPIGAILLTNGTEFAWLISSGIHRVCVLKALNYDYIRANVKEIVFREDYKEWSGVKQGLYTEEEALKLFDMILHENQ